MFERLARFVLPIGVVATALVALPNKLFELDRYFVPKELVLNLAALLLAAAQLFPWRTIKIDRADALLALFLAWSAGSAIFAGNHWLAQRALGISLSGAIIFWSARRLGLAGSYRVLLVAASIATVAAAATALAQAYGFGSDYFTTSRMPGGTLGNRNFIAHVAAIGLPVLVWCTVTTKRSWGALLGSLGAGVLAAALVLSRSRAAWVAVAASALVLAVPLLLSRKYWRGAGVGGRLARILLACFVAAAAAILLPNKLNWNSDSPYLDSARGVVDYSKGSGKGRLLQYENSMRMALANPIFGVGPGNWAVRYVKYAPSGDRSITEDGMTANPWPSSDWVAFISERGVVATLALVGMFLTLFFGAFKGWRGSTNGELVLLKLTLAGTIVATLVVGSLDVTLLLAAPAFLVWLILGAAAGATRPQSEHAPPGRSWKMAGALAALVLLASTVRSAAQIAAMSQVGEGAHRAGWVSAARLDPGSYRINLRVADLYANRGQCALSKIYANRAAALFPLAPAAKRAVRRCN
jgi:O-antigen ligase